jgi:hypothetical protein
VIPSARHGEVDGRLRKEFPVTTAAVAQARRWATDTVTEEGHVAMAPVVALLVSELTSNVLLHAGGDHFSVEVSDRAHLEIRVCDGSSSLPHLHPFTMGNAGGRGLAIVNALADAWGVETRSLGKCVWFRLDTMERA